MDQVGLNMEEKYNMFQIVAAVLHLGNITFEENTADRKGTFMYILLCSEESCSLYIHIHIRFFCYHNTVDYSQL